MIIFIPTINNFNEKDMETFQAIINRRSIRKYKSEKIEEEKIQSLLRAAMYAPSAMNLQPWHFIVINSLDVINETVKSVPHSEMIKQSGAAILICGDSSLEKMKAGLFRIALLLFRIFYSLHLILDLAVAGLLFMALMK